jgi:hypothetical protein
MRILRYLTLVCLAATGLTFAAAPVVLKPDHPERYVVRSGDTLWGIAGRFLHEPWRWPQIHQANPQIANPDHIYPGDVITLIYANGQPRLVIERAATSPSGDLPTPCRPAKEARALVGGMSEVKLKPRARCEELPPPIPAIPVDAIQQFLSPQIVASGEQLRAAPYIVDFAEEHIAGSANDRIYVRAIEHADITDFSVVRPGKPYIDPDSGVELGYEAKYLASADLERPGDPATLRLRSTEQEVLVGDKLLPNTESEGIHAFYPKPPERPVQGRIIAVLNGVREIGQYQTVVLNRGAADGLARGDVLRVQQGGERERDRVRTNTAYTSPLEDAGILLVFRTFERVSFALVMRANKPLHVLDRVANPEA